MRWAAIVITLAMATMIGSSRASAEEPSRRLRYKPEIDIVVTGMAGVAWVTSELLKRQLAPLACRWCDRGADGSDTLNRRDLSAHRRRARERAILLSYRVLRAAQLRYLVATRAPGYFVKKAA